MKWLVIFLAGSIGLAFGLGAAFVGFDTFIFFLPFLIVVTLIFDYRIAVVFLSLALAVSSSRLLPGAQGFNPITYAIIGTAMAVGIRRLYSHKEIVWLPKPIVVSLVAPLFIGAIIGLPHLGQAYPLPIEDTVQVGLGTVEYLKTYLMRPLFFIAFSLLLANAVRDSRHPARFVILFSVAICFPVTIVFAAVVVSGANLAELQSHRGFLSAFGMHSNEFGKLLAFGFGPLLYLAYEVRTIGRIWYAFVALAVFISVIATFSRAAYVAIIVVFAIFLWQRRQIKTVIATILLIAILGIAAPNAVWQRVETGIDSTAVSDARYGRSDDKLTAGRIGGYLLLGPEVLRSPLWGRGTGSTMWSAAVARGLYQANHPHNLYLGLLMDVGLLGFGAALYFYYLFGTALRRLGRVDALSDELRAFFRGAWSSLIGMLVFSFSGGYWYPQPEQTFMWFAFGMTLAFWSLTSGRGPRKRWSKYSWGIRPLQLQQPQK